MQVKRLSSLAAVSAIVASALLLSQPLTAQQASKAVPQGKSAASAQPVAPQAAGVWIDHTGRGAVEIAPCPEGLCGRIVWLQQPNDKSGQLLRDERNEDRAKRSQPICGLQIIGGLKLQTDGSWDNGWIYDPDQGERFDVELRLRNPDQLQVKGYKGVKFLSETYQWKRAATPPEPRCAI
ncbi:MAG: DUF2147 domain-containing protein [Hyphomicrobiaceae bacterium]